jgi:hypothetical protein
MSKVIPFGSTHASRGREFGLDDLLDDAFDAVSAAGISVAPFRAAPKGDWGNQELASIHRAVRLLRSAGVTVETDRGVTDDGSPWTVFCTPQGDVLVHIARIDSEYFLDGVGLNAPLKGKTFDDLVNRFVERVGDRTTSEKQTNLSNLLDLATRRNRKVFVHPAAQLAALIWTAMIVKDLSIAQAADTYGQAPQGEPEELTLDLLNTGPLVHDQIGRQELPEKLEQVVSGAFAKSRESQVPVIQSAGLLSLAYFLIGSEHLSPGAVLELHKLDADQGPDGSAASDVGAQGHVALDLFLDALVSLASALPQIDELALQDTETIKADLSAGLDTVLGLPTLGAMPEKPVDAGLSLDGLIAVEETGELDPVDQPHLKAQAYTVFTDAASPSVSMDDLLDYLDTLPSQPFQGEDIQVDEILALVPEEDGVGLGSLAQAQPDIEDVDVISAILEFLRTADDELAYYREEGLHIIAHGGVLTEGSADTMAVSWTFDDGSQILIMGAADALVGFDFLL